MENSKLLIIGIDGATWDIIDPLIERGKMKNLGKLITEGAAGPLESTVIPNTPPAWTAFLTGKNPGKTGIYDFFRRQTGEYNMKVCTSLDNKEPTIFGILSRAGYKICSVNIPMTYPPERINGTMISGIPLPPEVRDYCFPLDRLHEIEREVGEYIVDIDYTRFNAHGGKGKNEFESYQELLDELLIALRKRQRTILYLLETEQADLFTVVYSIVDRVQHYFWRFIDPSHSGYSEEGARRFGHVIENIYEQVDLMIGELLGAAPDHNVMVMSDHGFGPYYRDFHLNRWLIEKGYLVLKKIPRWTLRRTSLGNMLRNIGLCSLSDILPGFIRDYPIPRPSRKSIADYDDIIWPETRAYSNLMGISLNLKGREPGGIVTNGAEYDELTSQIMNELKELRDDKTGEKIIDAVDVKENMFLGPRVYQAADVYFMIAGLSYNITKRLAVDHMFEDRTQFGMSGTHRMDGIVIIRSDGVKAGTRLEKTSILDIPSTVLYLMHHPILKGMDGRVLTEIFEENYCEKYPVEFIEEELIKKAQDEVIYTQEEENEIRDLLKGLGYLS